MDREPLIHTDDSVSRNLDRTKMRSRKSKVCFYYKIFFFFLGEAKNMNKIYLIRIYSGRRPEFFCQKASLPLNLQIGI